MRFNNMFFSPYGEVFLGLILQSFIAGLLGITGVIELSPTQQILAVFTFLVFVFIFTLFTQDVYWTGLGMATQAFLSFLLAKTGIVPVSAVEQLVFTAVYFLILFLLWLRFSTEPSYPDSEL